MLLVGCSPLRRFNANSEGRTGQPPRCPRATGAPTEDQQPDATLVGKSPHAMSMNEVNGREREQLTSASNSHEELPAFIGRRVDSAPLDARALQMLAGS